MAMQIHYISAKPLGFQKENRLTVPLRGLDVIEKYDVIKNELLSDSRIKGVTASDFVPGTGRYSRTAVEIDNEDGSTGRMILSFGGIGDDFLEVMGIELVTGRDFSKRLLTDAGRFLVNEALVRKMGWSDPIGKSIRTVAGMRGRVIGVVRDFHSQSLKQSMEPFVLYPVRDDFSNIPPALRHTVQRPMILHVSETDARQTLKFLQDRFAEWDPRHPFEPEFLDDTLAELYVDDARLMKITGIFSGICIFISCMGLFGLASFTTQQRSREIGIRKVVGASAARIILMLSQKILWLVLTGSIVASAVAYYAIDQWMTSGFVYRVGINPLAFALSAAAAIAVAYITIALQSYRTARANPAKMLRYE
jgi:putative ABC transport system permease protein